MSLKETLNNDIKVAMKAKEKEVLSVLRMLKTAVQSAEIDKKAELTPEEELTILAREIKQRRESLAEFVKAERQELIEKVTHEIEVVERYLPKQLSSEEMDEVIAQTAAELGVDSMQGFGRLMGAVMSKVTGQADGNVIKEKVKEFLSTK